MPKVPRDYSNGLIYVIFCRDRAIMDLYIGSTTNFRQRKSKHKTESKNRGGKKQAKVYNFIREHGGWDNWDIMIIEKFPCNYSHELLAREMYWQELLKSSLNSGTPSHYKMMDGGTLERVGPKLFTYVKPEGSARGYYIPVPKS